MNVSNYSLNKLTVSKSQLGKKHMSYKIAFINIIEDILRTDYFTTTCANKPVRISSRVLFTSWKCLIHLLPFEDSNHVNPYCYE